MGRTTWEQCLLSKPLKGRLHVVIGSERRADPINNVVYRQTLFTALSSAMKLTGAIELNTPTERDIWVIGGESIYNQLVHLCDEIHISHIDDDQDGDVTFIIPPGYRGKVHNYYFTPNGKD